MPKNLPRSAKRILSVVVLLALLISFFNLSPTPAIAFSPANDSSSEIKILKVTLQSLEEGAQKQTIIEGTAPANSQVVIFIQREGEQPLRHTATANETGRWQLTLDYQLEFGSYQLWAIPPTAEGAPVSDAAKSQLAVFLPSLAGITPLVNSAPLLMFFLFPLGFLRLRRKEPFSSFHFSSLISRGPPPPTTSIALRSLLALLTLITLITNQLTFPKQTYAAINPKLSYQGKLTDGDYAAVADGAYHMEFKLYTAATGGSAIWIETWDNSYAFSAQVNGQVESSGTSVVYDTDTKEETIAVGQYLTNTTDGDYVLITAIDTGTNTITTTATNKIWADDAAIHSRIRAVNGIFNVELGTVDGFSTSDYYDAADNEVTAAQWNSDLYLTVNVGGSGASPSWDGEMTPRKYVASLPQAHNADLLDGIDSASFLRSDAADVYNEDGADIDLRFEGDNEENLLFLDASTDRVGIGTTVPGAGLEIEIGSADAEPGLIVDQDDLDQIAVQIVQAADATANALDISSLQVSGDVLDIDWSASETQQGALTGIDVDLSNLIDDNASAIYGVHINDFNISGGGSGTQYGLYIEGTNWDAGLYSADASTIADTLTVGASGNTFTFNPASGPVYAGDARPAKRITLSPEYSGGTLTAFHGATTDTSLTGDMTADAETTAADDLRTYYEWSSAEASLNYYTVAIRVKLPKDFAAWATSNAFQVDFTTESTTNTNCFLDVFIYLSSNSTTAVASDADDNAAAGAETWESITIDDSVLDDAGAPEWDAADEVAIIYLRMASKDDNFVRVGDIKLNYLAQF